MHDTVLKRFITGPELARRHACCSVTVWRRVKAGIYPQPVRFSPGGRPVYDLDAIEELERKRAIDARPEPAHAA